MTDTNPGAAGVQELLRQREQLRAWIAKLDEVSTGTPGRVAARVRADYEDRLRRVTEELGAHREEIERDAERLRAEAATADERHAQAADELEEARLRHAIGEIDESSWQAQERALLASVADAEGERDRLQAELERIAALAAEVSAEGGAPEAEAEEEEPAASAEEAEEEAPAPAAEAEPEAEPAAEEEQAPQAEEEPAEAESVDEWDPFGSEFEPEPKPGDAAEELPWLEGMDEKTQEWTAPEGDGLEFLAEIRTELEGPAPAEDLSSLGDDDLAFLEELDRAISGSPAATPAPPAGQGAGAAPPADGEPASGPAAGNPYAGGGRLLCKECGALNEPHSWYCEICGSEL